MKKEHNVPEHSNEEKLKDHYHGKHHFDSKGQHDDIEDKDFAFINTLLITGKRNMIYKLVLAGFFMALAFICTILDGYIGEKFLSIPTPAGMISVRYLDVTIIILSIGSLGPVISSLVAFVVPYVHFAVHSEHSIYSIVLDSFGYVLLIWLMWTFYYVISRNSYYHKDPVKKKDLFKRWMPIIPFVLISSAIFAFIVVLSLYLSEITGAEGHDHEGHDHEGHDHEGHDHENEVNWDSFKQKYFITFIVFFFIEVLRFTIVYVLYAAIEPKLKLLNHKYR